MSLTMEEMSLTLPRHLHYHVTAIGKNKSSLLTRSSIWKLRMEMFEENQFQLLFRRDISTKCFILGKDSVKSISGAEGCRSYSLWAWAYRAGKWSPGNSQKVQLHFHKNDFCAFSANQFWQTSVQILPNSSAQYQQQWFLLRKQFCWVLIQKPS